MKRLNSLRLAEKWRSLFEPLRRTAFLTSDFELLYLKTESLADVGTLPQCAEVSQKYMQLQDGDIIVTSDPYSGGTVVSSPTLVIGIGNRTQKGVTAAEFLLASRITSLPRINDAKTIDEEGLRIPPTPFYIRGEPNVAIIEALRSHPLATKNFVEELEAEAKKLKLVRERVKLEITKEYMSRTALRQFLSESGKEFGRIIDELSVGVGTYELGISPNETIKVRAEIHEGQVFFDFTGTTAGQNVFMTDSATMGAAVGALISMLGKSIPINSGVLSKIDIKSPKGSLVNSAFPRPLYVGHTDGLSLLANAVTLALGRIDQKLAWAASGWSHCAMEIRFQNGRHVGIWMPVGTGATRKAPGIDCVHIWRRLALPDSIEDGEKQFPVQVTHIGFRSNSGGPGKYAGGRGVAATVKMIEDVEIAWNYLDALHKPEGVAGGKSGQGPEIVIHSIDGTKTSLPTRGRQKLRRGDMITILSPGGGGYGAPEEQPTQ